MGSSHESWYFLNEFKRHDTSVCWVEQGEPVFRAWVEGGRCYLLPFFSFLVGSFDEEHQTVTLEFGAGTVWIIGPKAYEFCSLFCNHKATLLKPMEKIFCL